MGGLASARGPLADQTLDVTVWGADGTQVNAAVTVVLPDGGTLKPVEIAVGNYRFAALPPKSLVRVEADGFDPAREEIQLPPGDVVHLDVVCVDPHTTEFLIDLGANAKNVPAASPFAGRPPVNDLPSGAFNVGVPSLSVGTTVGATVDGGLPEGNLPITSPGVWYVVPGTGTTMSASTCGSMSGFDTKISVFCDGSEGALVAGNDDGGCAHPFHSAVTWCSEAGQEYRVLVHGFGGQVGRFQLAIDADATPCTGGVSCSSASHGKEVLGACCLPTQVCQDGTTQFDCELLHGTWQGVGTTCSGGPQTFGILDYDVNGCDSPFESILETGPEGPSGDDDHAEVPIGFNFTFYGNSYSSVKMSTNGYLTFGDSADDWNNVPCTDPSPTNNFIAPLWDDLVVFGHPLLGTTHYQTLGVPGDRRFIAQWTFVNEWLEPLSRATFQAVLFEADGCIEFRYSLLHHVPSFPGDTTVGLRNADGSSSRCIDDGLLYEGACYRFCPILPPPSSDCPCVTIDFETDDFFVDPLVNGEQIWPNVNGVFGNLLTIEVWGSGVAGGAIFDTDPNGPNQNGHDPDLLVDTGNALICQSSNYPQQTVPGYFDHPNDSSTGGNVDIYFTDYHGVAPVSIDLIDICNTDSSVPMQIVLWDYYGNCRFYSVPRGFTEDLVEDGPPGYRTLYLDTLQPQPGYEATATARNCSGWFDQEAVTRIEINANASAAFDNLQFCRHLENDFPD